MHLISGALRMTLIPLYQTEQQVLYVLGSSSLDLKPVEQRIAYFDDKLPPLFCVKSNELQHELSIQPFTFMYQSGYIFRPFLQLYFKVGNSTNTYWYILLLLLLVDLPRHVTDSIGLSNQKLQRQIDSPSLPSSSIHRQVFKQVEEKKRRTGIHRLFFLLLCNLKHPFLADTASFIQTFNL